MSAAVAAVICGVEPVKLRGSRVTLLQPAALPTHPIRHAGGTLAPLSYCLGILSLSLSLKMLLRFSAGENFSFYFTLSLLLSLLLSLSASTSHSVSLSPYLLLYFFLSSFYSSFLPLSLSPPPHFLTLSVSLWRDSPPSFRAACATHSEAQEGTNRCPLLYLPAPSLPRFSLSPLLLSLAPSLPHLARLPASLVYVKGELAQNHLIFSALRGVVRPAQRTCPVWRMRVRS